MVLERQPSLMNRLLLLLWSLPLFLSQQHTAAASVAQETTTTVATTTAISVNVNDLLLLDGTCQDCHRFDGIGAISGGGATSRLLVDYPADVQSEILDFLFLPNYGASLHMLKVEIGGDSYSTDGSESSHMHSQDDLNLERGYEWWLLKEAKKRNPNILTYGLPWAFPGWISEDKSNPFLHLDKVTNYTLQWVKGAKEVHGIDLDYLGIWNEKGTSKEYLLAIRKVLDKNNFTNIKLVSNDGQPNDLCPIMANDTDYIKTVDVLGFHYPNDQQHVFSLCSTFGHPIWASEESSSYDDLNGAACWARVMASHYVLHNMTANIMWNLVGAYMHGTNWYASSLLTAVQPWSGYYEWEQLPVVWATAHYTQFIQPGWQFLPVGKGSGELAEGGYYLTLVSPDYKYFTVIIVKISRDHAPCTRPPLWNWNTTDEVFNLTLDLPVPEGSMVCSGDDKDGTTTTTTQTWYSNLEQEATILFEKLQDHDQSLSRVHSTCHHGEERLQTFHISLNVTVGSVFTVTNQLDVGYKAKAKIHKDSNPQFPLPYYDDFNAYDCNNCYPKYTSDQMGVFELQIVDDTDTRAMVQMAPDVPVGWFGGSDKPPVTLIGMTEWEDVRVEVSFKLPDTTSAACIATRTDQHWFGGVSLCVNTTRWTLMYGGPKLGGGKDPKKIISTGNFSLNAHEWYNLGLATNAHQVEGSVEGTVLTATDLTIRVGDSGFVALGADAYVPVQFGHLHIKAIGSSWSLPPPSPEPSPQSTEWTVALGLCTPNGLSKDSERFDVTANWQIQHVASGKCVTVSDNDTPHHLSLQDCIHDHAPQQFRHKYTVLRNGNMVPLTNAKGDLCATSDGKVSVTNKTKRGASDKKISCAGTTESFFKTWALYPNTQQLRNTFGYGEAVGGRAQCLQAVPTTMSQPLPE